MVVSSPTRRVIKDVYRFMIRGSFSYHKDPCSVHCVEGENHDLDGLLIYLSSVRCSVRDFPIQITTPLSTTLPISLSDPRLYSHENLACFSIHQGLLQHFKSPFN